MTTVGQPCHSPIFCCANQNADAITKQLGETKQLQVGVPTTDSCKTNTAADESYVGNPKDLKQINPQGHGELLQETAQHDLYTPRFDQKYDKNGYFGFENIGTPEGFEPGKISEREKLSLLIKEKSTNSKSSPDESSINEG